MEKSLEKFQERFPDEFSELKETKGIWKVSLNPIGGEKDLVSNQEGFPKALFGNINIFSQLRHWLSLLPLTQSEVLIVYGLGLGHPYQALKSWLRGFSHRRVIFLEDDPDVLHEFFKMEASHELLDDPQAEIRVIPSDQTKQQIYFKNLAQRFLYHRHVFTGIPSYQREKANDFQLYKFYFEYQHYIMLVMVGEILGYAKDFYQNFWGNLHHLRESKLFSKLKDTMQNTPAIIVGAGPSLGKQIPLLKTLQDKALIISGGTATNVLNANGINPHLTLALDPFESSFSRAIAYTCFETPVIYNLRYNKKAFEATSGPLIYLNGGASYDGEKWMENYLGIENLNFDLGTNVVNASCTLASFMGCDPLITVGVDLAYTEGASYGPGIKPHAITPDTFKSRVPEEEMIFRSDIYGNPVKTLLKWVTESLWYSAFDKSHPDHTFVNATEGGIGFSGVENIALKEAADKWLNRPLDISQKLKTHISEAHMPESENTVTEAIEMLSESFKKLDASFAAIHEKNRELFNLHDVEPEIIDPILDELKDEIAFEAIVAEFDRVYKEFIQTLDESDRETSPAVKSIPGRLHFLWNVVKLNKGFSERALSLFPDEEHEKTPPPVIPMKEGKLHGTVEIFWTDGSLRRQYQFSKGKREGKDQFWNRQGQLILEAEYKDDLPVNTASTYTDEGRLIKQVIYGENGEVKDIKSYDTMGSVIPEQKNYFERVGDQAKNLRASVQTMFNTLKSVAKAMPNQDKEINTDIDKLSEEMERLEALGHELATLQNTQNAESKMDGLKEMKQDVESAVNQLKELSQQIEFQVKDVRKKLND